MSFAPGVGSVMPRNPEWWGLGQNPHNLDRIVHTVIKDRQASRRAARRRGRLPERSTLADLDRVEGTPGLKLARTNETRTIFLGLDQGSRELRSSNIEGMNPFADRRVRQAVYQAIDVETIRDEVMSGLAIPTGIIIQPGIDGYAPELDMDYPSTPMLPRRCSPRPAIPTASP